MGGVSILAACLLLVAPSFQQFQRGAVEQRPLRQYESEETSQVLERLQLGGGHLGTRRLPLRAAVEHHLTAQERAQQHIPLREAVESRPESNEYVVSSEKLMLPYSSLTKDSAESLEADNENTQIPGQERYPTGISSIGDYRVVCYLESWAAHRREPMKFFTKEFNPHACTHLIYAFASLDPHSLKIVPQDEEFDIVKGGYKAVMQLKEINPNLKVLISLGGWVEAARRYSEMASSASSRREFIRSVDHFLDLHGFDGLDLFWEFPGAKDLGAKATDKDNFVLLAEALSEVFAQKGRLLSAAVSPSRFRIEDGYNVPELSRYLDFFNVMSYDLLNERDKAAYHPSPLYRRSHDQGIGVFLNVDYAISYWLRKGVPSRKLILGLPFFGRSFTLEDPNVSAPGSPIAGPGTEGKYTLQRGFLSYFEICERLFEGKGDKRWMQYTDEVGSPYMVLNDQWVGYDSPKSIKMKMDYVRKYNLGGAMVWAVDMDDFLGFCGKKYPLLSAINEGLKERTENKPATQRPTTAPIIAEITPAPQPAPTRPPIEAVEAEAAMVAPVPGQEIVTIGPGHSCKGHGFAREPTNCRVYYRCEWGVKTTYICPEGLHYDATLQLCNWPEKAGCEQVILIPEKYVLTPLQQFLLKFAVPYQPTYYSTLVSQQEAGIDCSNDGLYTDPSSQSYILCQNKRSYSIRCPEATTYNIYTNLCEQQGQQVEQVETNAFVKSAVQMSEQLKIDTTNPLNRNSPDARKEKGYKVVCYFTNWSWYRKDDAKFVPEHLDPRLCTHVVYAFAALEPHDLKIIPSDTWTDFENNFYQRVTSIHEPRRGDADVKVLLSLGGWTDSSGDKYSRLVGNEASRRKFIAETITFLKSHNFGGLHLDWYYPRCWQSNCGKGPASDRDNFAQFIKELRAEFNKQSPPLELAVAISGYKEVLDVAYNVPEISKNVDFMSVMTYDYHGAWEKKTGHVSPLFYRQGDRFPHYNTNFTLEYLVSMGADREKVIMGIPLYGQSFTLDDSRNNDVGAPTFGPGEPGEFTKQPGMLAYFEICEKIRSQNWKVVRDKFGAHGPYAYSGDQWVGYEDIDSVKEKGRYIRNMGFGGAMVWTVDLDDFTNRCCKGPFPLLRAINRIFERVPATSEPSQDCTKPPQPITPAPPTLTTGVDTGAESPTTPMTTRPTESTTTSPWWTQSSTTSAPTTVSTTPSTTTTTTTTTTTRRPVTTTSAPPTSSTTSSTWWPTSSTTTGSSTWWPQQSTTTNAPVSSPVGSNEELLNKPCEPGEHHPDRQSCNAYYRCILGKLKREFCAGGLHWNPTLHACDWPKKAGCQKDQNEPTTSAPWWPQQPPTMPTTTTQRPNEWWTPSTTEMSQQIVEGRPTPSPPKSCTSGSYDANPADCGKFFICVNGRQTSQNCASGLYWNQEKKYCDWPSNVQCAARSENEFTEFEELNEAKDSDELRLFKGEACSRDFMRDPTDCSVFYRCENGKVLSVEHCADGLHFNEEQRHCDWPDSAGCTSSGGDSASAISTTRRPSPATVNLPPPTEGWTHQPPKATTTTIAPIVTDPAPAPCTGKCLMVCYFTNWAWYRQGTGKYFPEDIDPALCTHIVYGFAVLDYENLIIKMHDSWADVDNRFYERVTEFKKYGKKVLIAIGGWNDSAGDKYSRLVNSPAARKRFIKHVIEFMQKYNFDGLDLDWEYPKCWQVNCDKGPDSDKQAFSDFIKELRSEFDAAGGYLLTAAVSPSKTVVDAGYDVPAVGKYLDYVSVMTYDFHGHWDKKTGHVAPLYEHEDDDFYFFNANFSINYWHEQGVPKCKIIMGMPLYGQSFTLTKPSENGLNAPATGPGQAGEFTRAAGFLSYYEICDRIKNKGYSVVYDPEGRMGPYAYKDRDWVSFDDVNTLIKKAQFVAKMGLGGSMIWALDLDDFKGTTCGQGKYPLLSAINSHMCSGSVSDTAEQTTKPPRQTTTLAPATTTAFVPDTIPSKAPTTQKPLKSTEAPTTRRPAQSTQAPTETTTTAIKPKPDTPGPGTEVATCGGSTSPCGPYKVVCYFTNWAWYRQGNGKYLPSDIDASLCTHIVYGFAVLDGSSLLIKPHDSWADLDNKFYEKVVALKSKGVKVLLAIGGWNDSAGDKYSKLVNNPGARARFIDHVLKFIDEYGFDGLDLDWEYPVCWQVDCKKGPASDKTAFAAFVAELRAKFGPNRLLSSAVSPSKYVVDAGYDVPALSKNLDWIAVMTYDYHGQWDKRTGHVAPMYAHPDDSDATFNTNYTINYWIKNGASPCKIVLGMPMYGQSFSLAETTNNGLNVPTYGGGEAGDETRARGFLSYYEICQRIQNKGWKVVQDPLKTMGPYAYLRDQWVSFDDQAMIRYKTDFIRKMGLAGGMIWALDLDDFRNLCNCEPHPLLRTINRGLCRLNTPAPDCSLSLRNEVDDEDTMKLISEPGEEETNPNDLREDSCSYSGLQKHPSSCSKYTQCVNGEQLTRNCPPGTIFIIEKQNCDWAPKDSTCLPQEGTGAESPAATQPPQEQKPTEPTSTPKPTPKPQPVTQRPVFPPQTGSKQCSDEFVPQTGNDMKVICYFTNWAIYRPGIGKYRAEDIDSNLCTHVLYGFAVLDGSTLTIKSHDPWADFDDGLALYSKVTSLKQKGIKVLLALGGWNDSLGDKYSRLVSSQASRSRFITQALEFVEKYKFDGLDLDWEYPKCWQVDCNKGPDADKENFASLVKELSAEFKPKGLLLSAAVSPSKMVIDAGYDVPVLSQYLDWISVMTYDYHGQWDKMTGHVSPFRAHENDTNVYFNTEYTMNYYIKKGADPRKLVMGIPLYAQSFTLIDQSNTGLDSKSSGPGLAGEFTRAAGFTAFYEVCHMVKQQQWTVVRDPSGAMGPYAYRGNQWMSYDDVDIVRDKMAFVKKLGISGAMIWALDLDDFTNRCGCGKYPLLRTINEELRGQGCKLNACT